MGGKTMQQILGIAIPEEMLADFETGRTEA